MELRRRLRSGAPRERWLLHNAVLMPVLAGTAFAVTGAALRFPTPVWAIGDVFACGTVAVVYRIGSARCERHRHVLEADSWLRTSNGKGVPSRYEDRAEMLCSPGERSALARALRMHLAAAQSTRIYGARGFDNGAGVRLKRTSYRADR